MTSYSEPSGQTILLLLDTEDKDEGAKIFRNVGSNLPIDR
jgi:hypothetical protein